MSEQGSRHNWCGPIARRRILWCWGRRL